MATFDPAAATAAYLATLSPAAHAKATAYTQGGHWLLLWGWLVTVAICIVIARSRVLEQVRAVLEREKPRPLLVSFVLSVLFVALDWVLELPWTSYASWWREAQYGVRNAAENLPLGPISALPGKAMRRLDQWRGLR